MYSPSALQAPTASLRQGLCGTAYFYFRALCDLDMICVFNVTLFSHFATKMGYLRETYQVLTLASCRLPLPRADCPFLVQTTPSSCRLPLPRADCPFPVQTAPSHVETALFHAVDYYVVLMHYMFASVDLRLGKVRLLLHNFFLLF